MCMDSGKISNSICFLNIGISTKKKKKSYKISIPKTIKLTPLEFMYPMIWLTKNNWCDGGKRDTHRKPPYTYMYVQKWIDLIKPNQTKSNLNQNNKQNKSNQTVVVSVYLYISNTYVIVSECGVQIPNLANLKTQTL